MRLTPTFITRFIIGGFAFVLIGCGGGHSTSILPAEKTYPIASAMIYKINSGLQAPVDINAQWLTVPFIGAGTFSSSIASRASFEGQVGLSVDQIFEGSVFNGPIDTLIKHTIYYDSNYNELGYTSKIGTEECYKGYTVVTSHQPLPAAAKVNDIGTLNTTVSYADSTKSFVECTGTSAYTIDADTDDSVIFHVTTKFYDPSNSLMETQDERYRINGVGHISFVSFDTVATNKNIVVHFTAH